jgi:hypothetical protein
MSSVSPPEQPPPGKPSVTGGSGGLHHNPWNWLLLVPLLMLITPIFNSDEPRLLGLPFFYWFQFLFVIIGVVCVAIVYVKTKHIRGAAARDEADDEEGRR